MFIFDLWNANFSLHNVLSPLSTDRDEVQDAVIPSDCCQKGGELEHEEDCIEEKLPRITTVEMSIPQILLPMMAVSLLAMMVAVFSRLINIWSCLEVSSFDGH